MAETPSPTNGKHPLVQIGANAVEHFSASLRNYHNTHV